jgi:hypothetical protein
MTTNGTVAVKALRGGKVHAGVRVERMEGWAAACGGGFIGGDYDVITESASHVNCARCLKALGREGLH